MAQNELRMHTYIEDHMESFHVYTRLYSIYIVSLLLCIYPCMYASYIPIHLKHIAIIIHMLGPKET